MLVAEKSHCISLIFPEHAWCAMYPITRHFVLLCLLLRSTYAIYVSRDLCTYIYIYVYSVYINESSHILGCSRYPVRKYHDMSPARHASADPRPSTKRATSTRLRQTTPLGDWGIMFLSWGVQTYPLVI